MRRIYRGELDLVTRLNLQQRGAKCNGVSSARDEWSRFRQTVGADPLIAELRRMAGKRERCFYCSDSLASDVEHFLPISPDFALTFSWPNLLWICAACNRKKTATYPIEDGVRILIDPTRDDPWRHLTLASSTGVLAPRYINGDVTDLRGEKTLKIVDVLNYEPLADGRARSIKRLREAVEQVIESNAARGEQCKLARAVREDDYGVACWFAFWEGRDEPPFQSLQTLRRPWRRFLRLAACQAA